MKKIINFALVFVLTAAMLVGCGCTNKEAGMPSAPTVLPTNEEVAPTTRETTRATTAPTTASTSPTGTTGETIDRGNGPLDNTSESAAETTGETTTGNARGIPGGAGMGSNGSIGGAMSRG